MDHHPETNPHFRSQSQPQYKDQHSQLELLSPQEPYPQHQQHLQPPNFKTQHQDQGSGNPYQDQLHLQPLAPWQPRQTNPLKGYARLFCTIFWVLLVIGGLAVLIVYLIFRPKTPTFDISTATLNAAYLNMGYLLNVDLTLLANFTNPNKKLSMEFGHMIIILYYGNTLIDVQYIEPFSAAKAETMFENVHMVSSQVRLPILDSQRFQTQEETNSLTFQVKGIFQARSSFGTLPPYSYQVHSHCSLVMAAPPNGALITSKCRTRR